MSSEHFGTGGKLGFGQMDFEVSNLGCFKEPNDFKVKQLMCNHGVSSMKLGAKVNRCHELNNLDARGGGILARRVI